MSRDHDKTTRVPVGRAGERETPLGRPPKWELAGRKRHWRAAHPVPEFVDWLAAEMASTGMTAQEICNSNHAAPSYRVLMAWVAQSPELEKTYLGALRVSVHTRISDLVHRAHKLMAQAEAGTLKKDQVMAFRAFANVIQWVAAKWNKEVYGDNAQTRAIVPVQIVTNLDFGQPGVEPVGDSNLYTIDIDAQMGDDDGEQAVE